MISRWLVRWQLFALVVVAACVSGCADSGVSAPTRPASINHVVLFKLKAPGEASELIADCNARLGQIEGVTSMFVGRHFETGRGNVESGYDVGLYVGFETAADYASYVEDPRHLALVRDWRSRLAWYQVYDVLDVAP